MESAVLLPRLLGLAWLLPLGSFAAIVLVGPRMGKGGRGAGLLATGTILASFLLAATALGVWLGGHPISAGAQDATGQHRLAAGSDHPALPGSGTHGAPPHAHPAAPESIEPVSGDWYTLARFGSLRLTIGYYIDALTVAMFFMVTLVAACIHFYSLGYMREELHEVTDPLVTLPSGEKLNRPGRFARFFQYFSLFCFSMLGLVIAGNLLMVFVFWELVGICSYLLIGFYFERQSASNAANKAFIVNRVGDFGMIVGLMAIWGTLGTLTFADTKDHAGNVRQAGIFSQVRPAAAGYALRVPDGMVRFAARFEIEQIGKQAQEAKGSAPQMAPWGRDRALPSKPGLPATESTIVPREGHAARRSNPALSNLSVGVGESEIASRVPLWRAQGYGYWLLVIAGLGIFCGCVGKSAQFPLHVWLPDAMEGPTPVSALIHAATMVAAGVYLVGRCYPLFTPEVLLLIACIGCVTLFIAATIAMVATDIKRVLAYSTVSQLGYMMLALGVGGWVAGLFHLFTHACFKALLFLGSGSVIHACGTNEMPALGQLRRKMPWTAYTMLVGCLAISGAGIPLLGGPGGFGLSGYYSKDAVLAQLRLFKQSSPLGGWLFYVAVAGAGLTAFYMFRLWYMTFAGPARNKHIYEHAHECPKIMYIPLVVLAVLATISGWSVWGTGLSVPAILEQARPAGTAAGVAGGLLLPDVALPPESLSHDPAIHTPAAAIALVMALLGFLLATAFYGLRVLDPEAARRRLAAVYWLLRNKWWFDEAYQVLFVRPTLRLSAWAAALDTRAIDWFLDHSVRGVRALATLDDWVDRLFVDGLVERMARWTHGLAIHLRGVQTGNLRHYVMQIVIGMVALFVLLSLYWSYAASGWGLY